LERLLPVVKHLPFDSKYRQDFQVVEERRGNVSLYPHTEQLPLISRALNLEFYSALPGRLARTDHRGDIYRKMLLADAARIFCVHINRDRADDVRLFNYKTPEFVAKVAVIQHIKESHPEGSVHRFRLFSGDSFLPEIHLNGRRIAFAGHVLERFCKRVPHRIGEDLKDLILAFYGSWVFSMPIGAGRAFVVPYFDSMLAFTYKETPEEYFMTTCLSVREVNALTLEDPVQIAYLHYGLHFTAPTDTRNWKPQPHAERLFQCWKEQRPLTRNDEPPGPEDTWWAYARVLNRITEMDGYPEGSRMEFLHHVHGPATIRFKPPKSHVDAPVPKKILLSANESSDGYGKGITALPAPSSVKQLS
jgi:hypothetical protein